MSDITKIEQAVRIYRQIKRLDADIIQLQKYAERLIQSDDSSMIIKLSIEKEFQEIKRQPSGFFGLLGFIDHVDDEMSEKTIAPRSDLAYDQKLDAHTVLRIVNVLYEEKTQARNRAIASINKLGLTI